MKVIDPSANKCPCTGHNLDKLLQPAILTLLAQHDLHGYVLVRQLAQMPVFQGQKPDTTGVYRTLRLMEKRGLLTSTWDTSESGPAKRLYRLTPDGRVCLVRWTKTLSLYREAIGELLNLSRAALSAEG